MIMFIEVIYSLIMSRIKYVLRDNKRYLWDNLLLSLSYILTHVIQVYHIANYHIETQIQVYSYSFIFIEKIIIIKERDLTNKPTV